jgi:hypothetical protein
MEFMVNDPLEQDSIFEVQTPLNFGVHVTCSYWRVITTIKHPIMAGRESDVTDTLKSPDEVRRSRHDPAVYLFYKSKRARRWLCAVVKRLDGEGFLVTSYMTDAVKEGVKIWPK